MDRMKTRFIIAVTTRLAAAEDSNAKTDLIEELSDNLYQRYLDLTASGMAEEEAYTKALDDLGDVDELLAYLRGLGPDGELPHEEDQGRDYFNEFLRGAEEVVRETISQTKDAVDQAKIIFRDVAEKLKEKYPNGFDGSIHVHFNDNDDDHGEHPAGEDHEDTERQEGGRDSVVSAGYSKERGGFYCERGQSQPVTGTSFPSQDLKGVDIKLYNGDVAVHLLDDPQADLMLDGDTDQLELRLSDQGILSIRQGKTASASFFFARGLASADVKLYLPRRMWTLLQISSVNGDIRIDEGLEVDHLSVKTTSGDLTCACASCRQLTFKSASGDLDCGGFTGDAQIDTVSGDITLSGTVGTLRCGAISGDVEVSGSVREARCTSASGDVLLKTDILPQMLELGSKSGDCEVRLPDSLGFTLQFSTVTGTLRSDFELVAPIGAKSGSAAYLDGGESNFRLSSVSGDITLRKI